jgi:hypothetical protein
MRHGARMKIGTTTHPKFRSLMRSLELPQYAIVGLLESVWTLAAQFADDGDLSRFSAQEIADYAGYEGDAEKLVNALVSSRWLDGCIGALAVHDWLDHCPHYVHDRRRKRSPRQPVPGNSRNVQEIPTHSDPTQPNPTMSNPTKPNLSCAPEVAEKSKPDTSKPIRTGKAPPNGFDSWYMIYPRKVGKTPAEKEYVKAIANIMAVNKVDEMEAIELLLQWTKERTPNLLKCEVTFQPYPAKWLKDGRYRDELAQQTERLENRRFAR